MRTPTTLLENVLSSWRRFDDYLARGAWGPTADGLAWFLLTLVILLQGWMRGFNLVVFIATFLLAMWLLNGVTTFFFGPALRRLRFRRRFTAVVYAGSPVTAALEVENPGPRDLTGFRVMDAGSRHRHTVGVHELKAGGQVEVLHQVVPARRGVYRWEPLRVSTAYPFGLFRRTVDVRTDEKETLVLPVLGKLDDRQFRRWLRTSQRVANLLTKERARRSTAPADFYGIRGYRSGDSPRWIHWRTTARVGQPMVKEFEEPPQQHLTVILEAWLPEPEEGLVKKWEQARLENLQTIRLLYKMLGPPTPEQKTAKEAELARKELPFRQPLDRLEQAVSLAGTLAWSWARKLGSNVSVGVLDDLPKLQPLFETGPALRTILPLLERLASVRGGAAPDPATLIATLEQRKIPRGPMVLISTHASNLHKQLAQAVGRPVQLLDISQSAVERFFSTPAQAVLEFDL